MPEFYLFSKDPDKLLCVNDLDALVLFKLLQCLITGYNELSLSFNSTGDYLVIAWVRGYALKS